MCNAMSQYMPNTAVMSDTAPRPVGSAVQPGRPLTRSEKSAHCPSSLTRPERCPMPRTISAAVSSVAPAVAITICPIAAPPAGSLPCARFSVVMKSIGVSPDRYLI